MELQKMMGRERMQLASSHKPPEKPPKKPLYSTFDFFDDFPHLSKKEKLKVIERMAVHCIWEELERFGFKVYGEQYIGKIDGRRKIIDLMVEKDGKFLGIEVKCKDALNTNTDFKQFQDYQSILGEKNIPFLVLWVPTEKGSPYPYDYSYFDEKNFAIPLTKMKSKEQEILKSVYLIFMKITNTAPFYRLDMILSPYRKELLHTKDKKVPISDVEWIMMGHPVGGKYRLEPYYEPCMTYRSLDLEGFIYSAIDVELPKPNFIPNPEEANFEHLIWKELRRKGYKVLCQVPVEVPSKPNKKIDLIAIYPRKMAIEVKYKVSKPMMKQLEDYRNSPTLIDYPLFLAIPKEEKENIMKFAPTLEDYNIGIITMSRNNKLEPLKRYHRIDEWLS